MYFDVTLMLECPARALTSASGMPEFAHQEIALCRMS
jgi:hypothetical protein